MDRKHSPAEASPATRATPPSRRGFLMGAAATGVAAAAVATLPAVQQVTTETTAPEAPPAPERGGGYRVSEHVKQYYQTTRI